jgi:hypothetical protein
LFGQRICDLVRVVGNPRGAMPVQSAAIGGEDDGSFTVLPMARSIAPRCKPAASAFSGLPPGTWRHGGGRHGRSAAVRVGSGCEVLQLAAHAGRVRVLWLLFDLPL